MEQRGPPGTHYPMTLSLDGPLGVCEGNSEEISQDIACFSRYSGIQMCICTLMCMNTHIFTVHTQPHTHGLILLTCSIWNSTPAGKNSWKSFSGFSISEYQNIWKSRRQRILKDTELTSLLNCGLLVWLSLPNYGLLLAPSLVLTVVCLCLM